MLSGEQCFAFAMFDDAASAEHAVSELIEHGFASQRIGVLMRSATGVSDLPMHHKTGIGPGIVIGTLLGAAVGAALPGLGLIAVGGAFSTLATAAAGGATGTLAGIVGGMGLWKDEVDIPRSAFARGAVLVGTLLAAGRVEQARAALKAAGAEQVEVSTLAEAEHELSHRDEPVRQP